MNDAEAMKPPQTATVEAVKAAEETQSSEEGSALAQLSAEDSALSAALQAARDEEALWTVLPESQGTVRKRVLVEGTGAVPEAHSTCLGAQQGQLGQQRRPACSVRARAATDARVSCSALRGTAG